MASLECKTCGGEVVFYLDSGIIKCEFCGRSQTLHSLLAEDLKCSIIKENNVPKATVERYKKAISLMSAARDEKGLIEAAEAFEAVMEFNSDALAVACRERADLIKKERMYSTALQDMHSEQVQKIKNARNTFTQISDYKDSAVLIPKCDELIAQAEEKERLLREEKEKKRLQELKEQEAQEKKEQKRRKKEERKRKRRGCLIRLIVLILVATCVWWFVTQDSKQNVSLIFEPSDDFLVEDQNGKYSFEYDVEIKNTGRKDIQSVRGTITFEYPENNVIIDTDFDFTSYDGAMVRSGKKTHYTWTITLHNYDTALILYKTDHDDMIITVNVEYIEYTDGRIKKYK